MSAFDLVRFRAYADLKAETQRTYLGFLWWVLEPLLFLGVFYAVLSALRGHGGREFVAFLLTGLVLWQWFKSGVSHSANAVFANLYLLRQVRVSPWIFPATVVSADTVKFAFVLVLLLLMLPLMGYPARIEWLYLLPVLIVELMLILGIGMLVAALVPFFPDLRFVLEALLHALLFLSGVFFSLDAIPAPYARWFAANPMASLIEQSRTLLMEGRPPEWSVLAWVALGSAIAMLAGLGLLARCRHQYPKLAA